MTPEQRKALNRAVHAVADYYSLMRGAQFAEGNDRAWAVAAIAQGQQDQEEARRRPGGLRLPDEEPHYSCTLGHCVEDDPDNCWAQELTYREVRP